MKELINKTPGVAIEKEMEKVSPFELNRTC